MTPTPRFCSASNRHDSGKIAQSGQISPARRRGRTILDTLLPGGSVALTLDPSSPRPARVTKRDVRNSINAPRCAAGFCPTSSVKITEPLIPLSRHPQRDVHEQAAASGVVLNLVSQQSQRRPLNNAGDALLDDHAAPPSVRPAQFAFPFCHRRRTRSKRGLSQTTLQLIGILRAQDEVNANPPFWAF